MLDVYGARGVLHNEVEITFPVSYMSFPPSAIFPAALPSNFIAYGDGIAAFTLARLMHKSGGTPSNVLVVDVPVVDVAVVLVKVVVVKVLVELVLDVVLVHS